MTQPHVLGHIDIVQELACLTLDIGTHIPPVDAAAYMCGSANVIDMAGNTVYAGFTDSHQHLEDVGRRTKTLSLFGISTLRATVQAMEDWAANIPAGEWVTGRGWIEREWTDKKRFLNKYDVDSFTADKPLFMPREPCLTVSMLRFRYLEPSR